MEIPTAGGTSAVNLRFRAGGADNTTSNYAQFWVMSRITGVVQSNNGSGAQMGMGTVIALTNRFVEISGDIINPNQVKTTEVNGSGIFYDATSSYSNQFNGVFDSATAFDGFTIYVVGTTITGTLKIYGYN